MRLILFQIGNLKVYSYGVMIAVGILVASCIFIKRAKEKGYYEDKLINLIIVAVMSGILGGKLLFIFVEIKNIIKNPSMLLNWGNGFVIYGAIILGVVGIYIYSRKNKWNIYEILDLAAPTVAIAQGFGRIGCFLAGCCYGIETKLPIGVIFPESSLAPAGVMLQPTQVYSSIFDFLLGFFLLWYEKKSKKEGRVLSIYVIIYSVGRFFIEFLRNDPRGNVMMLSTSQFIAIITLLVGIYIYNKDRIKERK